MILKENHVQMVVNNSLLLSYMMSKCLRLLSKYPLLLSKRPLLLSKFPPEVSNHSYPLNQGQ